MKKRNELLKYCIWSEDYGRREVLPGMMHDDGRVRWYLGNRTGRSDDFPSLYDIVGYLEYRVGSERRRAGGPARIIIGQTATSITWYHDDKEIIQLVLIYGENK